MDWKEEGREWKLRDICYFKAAAKWRDDYAKLENDWGKCYKVLSFAWFFYSFTKIGYVYVHTLSP